MSKTLKIILSVIVALLIALLLYGIFSSSRTFKTIDLNFSENKVLNYSNVVYLDTIAHVGLHELEIENIEVTILDLRTHIAKNLLPGLTVDGFVIQLTDSTYQIFINPNLSRNQHIYIMSHELIHVQQNVTERLIMLDIPYVIWKGDTLSIHDWNYEHRPWETEAYREDKRLQRSIRRILY